MTLMEIRRQSNIIISSLANGNAIDMPLALRFINRGYRTMNNLALFNTTALSASTTNGTRTVSLPADFIASLEVRFSLSPVSRVPYSMINTYNTTAGVPLRYAIMGSSFYFDPIPNATGSTLTGFYVADTTDLTTATSTPSGLPANFHDYLIDFVVNEGLNMFGKPEAALVYKSRFDSGLKLLINHFEKDRAKEDIKAYRAEIIQPPRIQQ